MYVHSSYLNSDFHDSNKHQNGEAEAELTFWFKSMGQTSRSPFSCNSWGHLPWHRNPFFDKTLQLTPICSLKIQLCRTALSLGKMKLALPAAYSG